MEIPFTKNYTKLTGKFYIIFVVLCFIFPHTAFSAWSPIVGIPEPPWGIKETAPALPSPWTSNTAGFYFVQADGTNYSGNGYPGNPRPNMPTSPPAGSVICLNGTISQAPTIAYNGTAENPIFIRSYNNSVRAKITARWIFYPASYIIFENINAEWGTYGGVEIYATHHLSIRNNDFKGNGIDTSSCIILQDAYLTGFGQQHHIVIDNNTIHDFGNWQTAEDQDRHGVTSNDKYTEDVWITNNTFFRLSGDAVQIGKIAYNPAVATRRYYVGANVAYETKQVAFWTKGAGDVIFSSNIAHDLRDDNPSGASAGLGLQCGPEYVWFINNIVYSTIGGIVLSGTQGGVGQNIYVLGNLFYNIHDTAGLRDGSDWNNPESPNGVCFMNRGAPNLYFYNNTCDDYDSGWQLGTNNSLGIRKYGNNVLTSRNTNKPGHSFLSYEADIIPLELKNNIIQNVSARIGSTTYFPMVALQTAIGANATNNIDDSPDYVNAATHNYTLQSGSPAIDTGIPPDVYETFQARYGLDISKDINGISRPQNSTWDIGAYEVSNIPIKSTSPEIRNIQAN
jgi:hypothetical protein